MGQYIHFAVGVRPLGKLASRPRGCQPDQDCRGTCLIWFFPLLHFLACYAAPTASDCIWVGLIINGAYYLKQTLTINFSDFEIQGAQQHLRIVTHLSRTDRRNKTFGPRFSVATRTQVRVAEACKNVLLTRQGRTAQQQWGKEGTSVHLSWSSRTARKQTVQPICADAMPLCAWKCIILCDVPASCALRSTVALEPCGAALVATAPRFPVYVAELQERLAVKSTGLTPVSVLMAAMPMCTHGGAAVTMKYRPELQEVSQFDTASASDVALLVLGLHAAIYKAAITGESIECASKCTTHTHTHTHTPRTSPCYGNDAGLSSMHYALQDPLWVCNDGSEGPKVLMLSSRVNVAMTMDNSHHACLVQRLRPVLVGWGCIPCALQCGMQTKVGKEINQKEKRQRIPKSKIP
eukprot:1158630-Pelagomonas_calceolata.AAC.7